MPIVVGYNSSVSSKLVVGATSNGLRVLCVVLCGVCSIHIVFSIFNYHPVRFGCVLVCACDTSIGVTLMIIFFLLSNYTVHVYMFTSLAFFFVRHEKHVFCQTHIYFLDLHKCSHRFASEDILC